LQPKIVLEPASTGSDSSSEDEPMEIVQQLANKKSKKDNKTPVKQKSSKDNDSEQLVPTVKSPKKKQVETKKTQKSPAVTKTQSKTAKVTKPVQESSSSEDSSDEEEPAKPVSKPVGKVKCIWLYFLCNFSSTLYDSYHVKCNIFNISHP